MKRFESAKVGYAITGIAAIIIGLFLAIGVSSESSPLFIAGGVSLSVFGLVLLFIGKIITLLDVSNHINLAILEHLEKRDGFSLDEDEQSSATPDGEQESN